MMKTTRAAVAVFCLAALHAYAQTQNPAPDAFFIQSQDALLSLSETAADFESGLPKMYGDISFQLQDIFRFLAETAEDFKSRFPDSGLPIKFANLVSDIEAKMTRYEDQLQRENLSSEERAAKLRKRYLTQLRRIYELEPERNYKLYFHERDGKIEMRFREKRHDGSSSSSYSNAHRSLMILLRQAAPYDSFTTELNNALDDLDKVSEATEKALDRNRRAMVSSAMHTGLSAQSPDRSFRSDDVSNILYDMKYELAKDDLVLAEQNLPPEKRAAKLRKRFFDIAERLYELEPYVEYEEASLRVNYSDYESKPVFEGGKRLGFDFPPKLTALLDALPAAKKRAAARGIRRNLLFGGAALLVLFLLGGVYFVIRFSDKREDRG